MLCLRNDHVIAHRMSQHTVFQEHRPSETKPPRLLDQVRAAIRRLNYSRRTEEAYVHLIKRYIFFQGSAARRTSAKAKPLHSSRIWRRSARWQRLRKGRRWRRCCSCTSRCSAATLAGSTAWPAPSVRCVCRRCCRCRRWRPCLPNCAAARG